MAAEGGLLEEPWHKAVILDHVNILLLESALSAPQLIGKGGVGVAGPEEVLARVLRIVRHGAAAADAAATDRRSIDVDDAPSYSSHERLLAGNDDAGPSGASFGVRGSRPRERDETLGCRDGTRKAVDDDRTRAERRPRAEAVTRRTDDGMSRARDA